MRLVANWFQTKSSIRQACGWRELSMVELKDDDLESFWLEWLKVISGQKHPEAITQGGVVLRPGQEVGEDGR